MTLRAIKTVYSYRFPETRRVIGGLTKDGYPHHVFMGATLPTGALDNFHQPIIDQVLNFYSDAVLGLKEFSNRYPTSGSEEGIREYISRLQLQGVKKIYVLPGEYEGYSEVARTRGIETEEVSPEDIAKPRPGHFFISNPSARDGNIIPDDFIRAICDLGHQVFYDLSYMGSTRPVTFDLSHPNVAAAVISFSKPYGIFYERVGFTFSRQPIDSLAGNKWFKNVFSLLIAQAIVKQLRPYQLFNQYRKTQEQIIDQINSELNLGLRPSDALLLAHLTAKDARQLEGWQLKLIENFKRGTGYRFCLTPYFFERDPEHDVLFEKWKNF